MSEYTLLVLLYGACVGSFLNVVIFRLPKNISFVAKRSNCPSCKQNLKVLDLVPILSWIFLNRRCRYCSNPIGIRYPLVELITSISFLLCLEAKGFVANTPSGSFNFISGCILLSFLIILSAIDIDIMQLPNSITYSGSVIAFVLIILHNLFINNSSTIILVNHLLGFLLGFFGIYLLNLVVILLLNKPGLGGGDAKLFAMSGAWLGLSGLEVSLTLSFLLSGIFALIGFIAGSIKRGDYIPFGPFICFSISLVWFFGPQFWLDSLGDIFWWKYL